MPTNAAQREIDEAFLEVSTDLALEELGGRRRRVFLRNRLIRTERDPDLGLPGYVDRPWTEIRPTPSTADQRRDFQIEPIGLIQVGDIEMRVDRLSISRQELAEAEFYMDDNPDSPEPGADSKANYDLIGGSVLEGGSGVRERYRSFWICYLRKRQV